MALNFAATLRWRNGFAPLASCQPDVLITDIKMPFIDGLQLCKIVRERCRIKIVILSAMMNSNTPSKR